MKSHHVREIAKTYCRGIALLVVLPSLCSFAVRSRLIGRDRALEGSTQWLALIPGLLGQYLRRAFLARTLAHCHHTVTVECGTIFSQTGAQLDENVYIGPHCHLGLVHLERDVMLAAGVHVPSGARTHGFDEVAIPIREQPGTRTLVRVGTGTWVGSSAVVMADVGARTVIGAGAVVTRSIPADVVAAGVPARIVRQRTSSEMSMKVGA